MDDDIDKQIQERVAQLPADVRQVLQSAELGQKVQAIGAKHQLHVDQIGALEDEVTLVMLGFADPAEFVGRLEEALKMSPEQADALAADVVQELFMPVRESMQRFMTEQTAQSTAASVTPATAPARQLAEPPHPKELTAHMPAAEAMLAAKTVATPPVAPPSQPPSARTYAKDPYREPVDEK